MIYPLQSILQSKSINISCQYFLVAEPCYILTLLCVKTSICLTLLRIVIALPMRYFLYFIMALNAASNFAALVALLNVCHPIAAMWNPNIAGGKCDVEVLLAVGYFVSATSLITDFSCAILPTVVLWNIQMTKGTKFSVITILSVGFLASSATIVRLPGIKYFSARTERLYHNGDIAIWILIECGLGIIAGSVAMTKPLVGKIIGSVGHEARSGKGTTPSGAFTTNLCTVDEIKTGSDVSDITHVELGVLPRVETAGSDASILEYP